MNQGEEKPRKRRKLGRPPKKTLQNASRDAKRLAAVVLEVLAGARTPPNAAAALGISLPTYYIAEKRALNGLVTACEPTDTTDRSLEVELHNLKKEKACLERECARHQALARASQRSIGLLPAAEPKPEKGKKRKPPRVRALAAVRKLQEDTAPMPDVPPIANGGE
jgi:hypothetical protein